MKYHLLWISLISIVGYSCQDKNYKEIILIEVDSLGNNKSLTREITKTINKKENKLVSILTKIHNKDNDYKTILLTGIKAEDGLTEWLVDSLFYPDVNDTLIVNFKRIKKEWHKNQETLSRYNRNDKIEYFKTERLFDMNNFKKEIFYSYNSSNKLIKEVEFECSQLVPCDSLYKKEYYYNQAGFKDSVSSLYWTNKRWELAKRKNYSR